jgi:hypothetical protein
MSTIKCLWSVRLQSWLAIGCTVLEEPVRNERHIGPRSKRVAVSPGHVNGLAEEDGQSCRQGHA